MFKYCCNRRAENRFQATRSLKPMRNGCSRIIRCLGKKYNPNLMIRQKINPGQTIDRMISVRFPGGEERVQKRKGLRIIVRDIDGAKTEIVEKL